MSGTFAPELLDRLRSAVPLPVLIGARVPLKRQGRMLMGLCPFHRESSPSFAVYDDHYHCFGCGQHGDAFRWFMANDRLSFPDAVERVAGEAGIAIPGRAARLGPRPAAGPPPEPPSPREPDEDELAEQAARIEAARLMWVDAAPIADDPARAYLEHRRLWPLNPSARLVLRFTRLRHPQTKLQHPVMLARVDGPNGDPQAVHRTYLTEEGRKLPGVNAKLALGPLAGCAIRLSGVVSHLGYAEGIETALAAEILTYVPTWATISAGVLTQQQPPLDVQAATIFADRDDPKGKPEGTGLRAARVLEASLRKQGVRAEIRLPREPFGDYADVLAAAETEAA